MLSDLPFGVPPMLEKKLSHIIKRDGSVKDFDPSKIAAAIAKAGKATGEFDAARADHEEYQVCPTRNLR